jgi:methylglyoxal synthase
VLTHIEHAMAGRKRIALIAHDNKKHEMLQWARFNLRTLGEHQLLATWTTGKLLEELGLSVHRYLSGPLGGDLEIAAGIAEGKIDALVFFWDPLQPQPHDPDVKALLRVAVVWNIPVACNWSSADFVISSPLMREEYARKVPNYQSHLSRSIPHADPMTRQHRPGHAPSRQE